jgi:hypothetical protein
MSSADIDVNVDRISSACVKSAVLLWWLDFTIGSETLRSSIVLVTGQYKFLLGMI